MEYTHTHIQTHIHTQIFDKEFVPVSIRHPPPTQAASNYYKNKEIPDFTKKVPPIPGTHK